jgi:hypothetical protein
MITYRLTSSQARSIAESHWGYGGTSSERTNTNGAFYFSCSAHGGFVIDGRVLTEAEREALKPHVTPDELNIWVYNGKVVGMLHWNSRRRKIRVPFGSEKISIPIYILEEDSAWALA